MDYRRHNRGSWLSGGLALAFSGCSDVSVNRQTGLATCSTTYFSAGPGSVPGQGVRVTDVVGIALTPDNADTTWPGPMATCTASGMRTQEPCRLR